MQRWWIGNNSAEKNTKAKDHAANLIKRAGDKKETDNLWKFQVFVNFDLNLHEKVAITGSIEEFGNWGPSNAVFLHQQDERMWSLDFNLPSDTEVEYRYFIASVDPNDQECVHVRKWETHLKPRRIQANSPNQNVVDHFGVIDGCEKVDKGWLTNETILQFKFFNNPFALKERIKNRLLYVKITPMNLRINAESSSANFHANTEESLESGGDTRENADTVAYAFSEVATLNGSGDEFIFNQQEQFGRAYKPNDIIFFHITVSEPENIAYLIDLYTYKSKSNIDDEPPHHVGYHYLLPNLLRNSEGTLELPITCASRHRPLGMMKIEFVKITPLNNPRCDMKISYIRHWNQKHKGLDVGHRGSGTSFKATSGCGVIRENTIASLKRAGMSGAKWVEFDVQLSKDLHPVIYHDFNVYVSLKRKATIDTNDMLELPMRALTLEQLRNLKVYHTVEGKSRAAKFFDENLEDHQPFPTLAEVLDSIDPNVGFNIEVKSAQQLEDGTLEDNHANIDKNIYVDCILDVVLEKAGKRRIAFSSFDSDICLMLRNKQNIYPTMFLTLGVTTRYKQYNNPCGIKIQNAVRFSVANELLGIVAHSEDILRDINQVDEVRDAGLVIWTWGEDNNSKDTIKYLKSKGIHAIIYDKIDLLIDDAAKDIYYVASDKSESTIYEQIRIESQNQL